MNFANEDKFKAYMKNEAKKLGISATNAYNTYFARDLLSRINKISFGKVFVKGSFSEFAHIGQMVRPITDIDFISCSDFEETVEILKKAMNFQKDSNFTYELAREPYQTNTGIYKVHLYANFGKIHHPISIDFQTNSKFLYSTDYKVIKPIFYGDEYFGVCVPSIEEYIAEKLYIVLSNQKEDVLNTRVKDFYDIWKLLECNYVANDVERYFAMMVVDHGKLDLSDLNTDFIDNDYVERHKETWELVKKKYEFLDNSVTFSHSVWAAKVMLNNQINKFYKQTGRERVRKIEED